MTLRSTFNPLAGGLVTWWTVGLLARSIGDCWAGWRGQLVTVRAVCSCLCCCLLVMSSGPVVGSGPALGFFLVHREGAMTQEPIFARYPLCCRSMAVVLIRGGRGMRDPCAISSVRGFTAVATTNCALPTERAIVVASDFKFCSWTVWIAALSNCRLSLKTCTVDSEAQYRWFSGRCRLH